MHVDLRIERIARIEIEKAGRNFEPAKWKRCVHIVQPHPAFQSRMQTVAGQMEIAGRAAIGEVTANQKRLFGLDSHVEFPIAKRRLRNRKIWTRRRRLRRRTPRQADWNEIEIFQELTVRQRDRAGDIGATKWPGDFD